jgi:hypothetical protein
MKCKALSGLRLLIGLLVFAMGSNPTGGFELILRQIETMGPRQWLNLMAGTIVAGTPLSEQIARVLPRRVFTGSDGDSA